MLVRFNRARSFPALLPENDRFCVNLLRSEHTALSDAFSGKLPSEERICHGTWLED
jgi:flavin reductase (DIM6/NTAB) family NADH-FMN oxidoreductase RutF